MIISVQDQNCNAKIFRSYVILKLVSTRVKNLHKLLNHDNMMTSIPQREINPIIHLRCANNQNIDYHYFGFIYLCCGDNDNCHLISAISNVSLIVIKGKIIVPSFS